MLVTPSLRHCSNNYKLAREGEKDKERDEDLEKVKSFFFFFFLGWSQVVLKEMSFQLLLEDWQGSSIPDGGGKIIPPVRNGEQECSGEWFWASLWWYHEASLTSRSQTSGSGSVIVSGSRRVLRLWLFYMQASVSWTGCEVQLVVSARRQREV